MASKKQSAHKKAQPARKATGTQSAKKPQNGQRTGTPKHSNPKRLWIVAAIAAVAIVVVIVAVSGGSKGGPGTAGAPAEEAKYMGRFLPAAYQEPKPLKRAIYTSTVSETKVQATDSGAELSIPLDQVTSAKIVSFEYQKQGSDPIPLIAYVKPSGKLFVGINFCPPCKGVGQRIEADQTLTCQTCGTKRHLETQIGVSGPCKLYPLDEMPSKIVGDKLVLEKSDLDAWTPQPLDRPTNG